MKYLPDQMERDRSGHEKLYAPAQPDRRVQRRFVSSARPPQFVQVTNVNKHTKVTGGSQPKIIRGQACRIRGGGQPCAVRAADYPLSRVDTEHRTGHVVAQKPVSGSNFPAANTARTPSSRLSGNSARPSMLIKRSGEAIVSQRRTHFRSAPRVTLFYRITARMSTFPSGPTGGRSDPQAVLWRDPLADPRADDFAQGREYEMNGQKES